ncbi:hypothetical protein H8D83_00725 [Candidatus Woesearchaeota archaeon]|nr:hypothetical protein [Candidatus Woesearchaeota archaeon]MBL7050830.1 hypothetical protein [Candidatus Woesearchaeota archaeon]
MESKTVNLLVTLTAFAFVSAFLFTFSCTGNNETLTGQAYTTQNTCVYCADYCGSTHTQDGGTIISSTSTNIKALEQGCTGDFNWVQSNTDVKLCCK